MPPALSFIREVTGKEGISVSPLPSMPFSSNRESSIPASWEQ